MSDATTNLLLPYILAAQAQKHVTHNEALRLLDGLVQLSVLDLANIGEGFTPADALANALDLAQHAEAAGFTRFWLAEHHNLAGIASAATAVCIGHVAGGTNRYDKSGTDQ